MLEGGWATRFLGGSKYLITRSNPAEVGKHMDGIYLEDFFSQWWPELEDL